MVTDWLFLETADGRKNNWWKNAEGNLTDFEIGLTDFQQ